MSNRIRLNCYGKKVSARRMKSGDLELKCPICKTPMVIEAKFLAWSKKEVRTKRTLECVLVECGFTFDIVHSNFVEQTPEAEEFYYDGQPRSSILKVWRTRNEHRRNPH